MISGRVIRTYDTNHDCRQNCYLKVWPMSPTPPRIFQRYNLRSLNFCLWHTDQLRHFQLPRNPGNFRANVVVPTFLPWLQLELNSVKSSSRNVLGHLSLTRYQTISTKIEIANRRRTNTLKKDSRSSEDPMPQQLHVLCHWSKRSPTTILWWWWCGDSKYATGWCEVYSNTHVELNIWMMLTASKSPDILVESIGAFISTPRWILGLELEVL